VVPDQEEEHDHAFADDVGGEEDHLRSNRSAARPAGIDRRMYGIIRTAPNRPTAVALFVWS
jgi:hypothetical protein